MRKQLTQDLAMIARNAIDYIIELERQRDALLEALVSFTKSDYIKRQHPKRFAKAVAAIAAAEIGRSKE